MINTIFKNFKGGNIGRRKYLYAFITLFLLTFLFFFLTILGIVGAETFMSGTLQEIQGRVHEALDIPYIIILVLSGIIMLYARLNIVAKRLRNIGFKNNYFWLVAVIFSLVSILSLLILFVPSNYIKNSDS